MEKRDGGTLGEKGRTDDMERVRQVRWRVGMKK